MSSNRVNEVAKTLTAYAAIFAAITLVTGVYGMNFQHVPELTWRFGYAYAIGLMIAAAGGLWVSANLSVSDGTTIAFDRLGEGAPVVLVSGASTSRGIHAAGRPRSSGTPPARSSSCTPQRPACPSPSWRCGSHRS